MFLALVTFICGQETDRWRREKELGRRTAKSCVAGVKLMTAAGGLSYLL